MNQMLPQRVNPPTHSTITTETFADIQPGSESHAGFSLGDLTRALRSHVLLILFCAAAAIASCFFYLHHHHPFYQASVTLRIDPSRTNALNGSDEPPAAELLSQSEAIETEAGVMKSNRVAALALESLTDEQFLQVTGYTRDSFFPVEGDVFSAQQERVLESVGSRTTVSPQDGSQLVVIGFRSQDPELAALMVNCLVSAYERQGVEKRTSSVEQLRSLLTTEMTALKTRLDTSEGQLADFQQKHSILGTGPQGANGVESTSNTVIDRLRFLNDRLAVAQANRIEKEGQFQTAENANAATLAVMYSDSKLNELQSQRATLIAHRAQLAAKFDSQYPPLVDINKQIDLVDSEITTSTSVIRDRLRQEDAAATFVENRLRGQLNAQVGAANELNRNEAQYAVLQQQVTSGRELYDSLQKKLQQAVVNAEVEGINSVVVDNANVPLLPPGPPKNLVLVSGGLLGLLGGLCAALVFEMTSDKIRRPRQVDQVMGCRILSCIPQQKRARKKQLNVLASSKEIRLQWTVARPISDVTDAYRAVRNKLLMLSREAARKSFVVLSASPGEGADIAATNIAIALAQADLRVLLVDGNLRSPSLHLEFDVLNTDGLGDVLENSDLRPYCTPLPHLPKLSLLTAGTQHEALSDDLASNSLHLVLQKWEAEFDYVIVSSTPLLQLSDSLLLAKEADGVLLVARYNGTRTRSLAHAREMLRDTGSHVVGILLNDVPLKNGDFVYAK
ncbi:MAG TPA: GNVR domain-containing protein [Candidatus Acidoferrales bacterium]|nr:GNVR domain-containing protein [Candidatus Acidoferrales bacterium]